jgi:hypothetical protein
LVQKVMRRYSVCLFLCDVGDRAFQN